MVVFFFFFSAHKLVGREGDKKLLAGWPGAGAPRSPLSWKTAVSDQNRLSLWASHFTESWESQGLSSSLKGGTTSSEFFPALGLHCIFKGQMPSPSPFPKTQMAFKQDRQGLLLSRKILHLKS